MVAPVVEKLMELHGTLEDPVHHIQFEGITFAHANWLQPSQIGHVEYQANFTVGQVNLTLRSSRFSSQSGTDPAYLSQPHGASIKSPASIVLHAAKSIRFERCKFTQLGSAGVDLEMGSQDNLISGCEFSDIAGNGIQIGDTSSHHPKDKREILKNNMIVNNYIHHVAADYSGGVGIFTGYTDSTLIAHNEISYLPYTGISIGWGFGEPDVGGALYWQPFFYDRSCTYRDTLLFLSSDTETLITRSQDVTETAHEAPYRPYSLQAGLL